MGRQRVGAGQRGGDARGRSSTGCRSTPGERPLVAIVGVETRGEHEARAALARRRARAGAAARRAERHDRWLDALGALAAEFQHEPGPDVIASALDILIRQTQAVDVGLASYVSGRLALHGTRRGALGATALTVAAHPQVGRALRDVDGAWLEEATARSLGVPDGLHAVGVPVAVAGEVLGLLVMVFDEVEPLDDDNRRLLAAISASVGFALLRDRLVRELAASASSAATVRAGVCAAAQPRHRLADEPRDLHLRDADDLADLGLRQVLARSAGAAPRARAA